jgi:hypothetical protein
MKAEIWSCLATGTGATVITANYNASVIWTSVAVVDVAGLAASPDDGVGNTAFGTGTSLSVALSGAGSTQTNELIIGYAYVNLATNLSAGAGYALIPSSAIFYSIVNSPGVNTATVTAPNNTGTNPWGTALAGLKHP